MEDGNKVDGISLEDALGAVNRMLKERLKILEERENELEKAKEAFRKEKLDLGCADGEPSDVLHLNVGGAQMAVLRRTMTSVEGSMLASKFSGRWDDSTEKDRDGNFFVDQPIELFKPMIDTLRAKASETPLAPRTQAPKFTTDEQNRDFIRMVEYFGMTPGIYPMEWHLHCGNMGSSTVSNHPDLKVSSTEWATFTLLPSGHDRMVKAFEVKLGEVSRAQVGWINVNCWEASSDASENNLGVGDKEYSVGLDCSRFGFLAGGDFTKIDREAVGEGTVIRCEGVGSKWFVDGEEVSTEGDLTLPRAGYQCVPAVSGKGNWQIMVVEFEN